MQIHSNIQHKKFQCPAVTPIGAGTLKPVVMCHKCKIPWIALNIYILIHIACKFFSLIKIPGSALLKYCKYTRGCTKGVLFRTSMYKMYIQETYCY